MTTTTTATNPSPDDKRQRHLLSLPEYGSGAEEHVEKDPSVAQDPPEVPHI